MSAVFKAAYSEHIVKQLRDGSVILDCRGVARWTATSGRRAGSIAGGLHPLAGDILGGGNTLPPGLASDSLVREVGALRELPALSSVLSSIGSVASVVNCGISAAAFIVVNRKLDGLTSTVEAVFAAVDDLPAAIRTTARDQLLASHYREALRLISQVSGASNTVRYAFSRPFRDRLTILAPVKARLDRDLADLSALTLYSIDAKNVEVARALHAAHGLTLQTLAGLHLALGDAAYLRRSGPAWLEQHTRQRRAVASLLLGGSPGLLQFAPDSIRGRAARAFFPSDLSKPPSVSEAIALCLVPFFQHQRTNVDFLAVVEPASVTGVFEPRALRSPDAEILAGNFRALAALTSASDLLSGSLELAPLRVESMARSDEFDALPSAIELLPETGE